MTIRKSISADRLAELDVHEGDLLRVVSVTSERLLIELRRGEPEPVADPSRAAEWVKSARGIVDNPDNLSAEDLRSDHYSQKYQLAD